MDLCPSGGFALRSESLSVRKVTKVIKGLKSFEIPDTLQGDSDTYIFSGLYRSL